ncbi:MAG: response regulator [Phycisphaera sp.]|nr:response regulator [Phycisphaera sp.]
MHSPAQLDLPRSISDATVFVIDDDRGMRSAIEFLLGTAGLNAKTYASGRAFLEEYQPRMHGCLLLDIRMPDISGLDFQNELRSQGVRLPVILISAYGTIPMAVRAVREGAFDFIEKPFDDESLLKRIREAIHLNIDQRVDDLKVQQAREQLSLLTAREKEVMGLVVSGMLNKQIAMELGISPKTVENHRSKVMDKMGVQSLAELVQLNTLLH